MSQPLNWKYNKWKLKDNREWKDSHETSLPTFCAWDGEGYNRNGVHTYFLLANSRGDFILNLEGLSTGECLSFILEKSNPGDTHVGFSFSYDVNMLLKDLPKDRLERLHKGWRVRWVWEGKVFRLRWIERKEFTVSNFNRKSVQKYGKWFHRAIPEKPKSVTIWDTIGFFQCSFVKALEQYLPGQIATNEMDSWKQKRATFSSEEIEGIKSYCFSELAAMVQLMDRLAENLATVGLHLARWDGAGSVAGAMMRKWKINVHQNRAFPDTITRWAQYAYSGGRIECVRVGHKWGVCTILDINSAYPSVLVTLPSLSRGAWIWSDTFRPNTFALWHVKWNIPDLDWENEDRSRNKDAHLIFPFFYRRQNGSIIFPPAGEGEYWTPEVQVALKYHGEDIVILGGWVWQSETEVKPYAWVAELYQQRKKWKAESNGAQMVAKLGMNSLYGKNAQSVAGFDGKPPSTHQLEWAGFTTSQTRAWLYDVAKANEEHLIYLATDGLGFDCAKECLELPKLGKELGEWDIQEVGGITSVKSGIYFLEQNGDAVDRNPKPKTRGYDPGTVTVDKVREAWASGAFYMEATNTRFIGLGFALNTGRWDLWRTWYTQNRKLHFIPSGKRQPMLWQFGEALKEGKPYAGYNVQTEFMPTRAAHLVHGFTGKIRPKYVEPGHSEYFALPWIQGGAKADPYEVSEYADEKMEV
jgi:hypothetical protein